MADPFDFSAGAVLTAAQLNEIGDAKTWTPVWTNLTIGNATQTATYMVINNLCFYFLKVALGSSSTVDGGSVACTTPVNTAVSSYQTGTCWLRPDGGVIYPATTTCIANKIYLYSGYPVSTGSYIRTANMTNLIPTTWDTDGEIYATGVYQIA